MWLPNQQWQPKGVSQEKLFSLTESKKEKRMKEGKSDIQKCKKNKITKRLTINAEVIRLVYKFKSNFLLFTSDLSKANSSESLKIKKGVSLCKYWPKKSWRHYINIRKNRF